MDDKVIINREAQRRVIEIELHWIDNRESYITRVGILGSQQ